MPTLQTALPNDLGTIDLEIEGRIDNKLQIKFASSPPSPPAAHVKLAIHKKIGDPSCVVILDTVQNQFYSSALNE